MIQPVIYPEKGDSFLLVWMGRAWDALRHEPKVFWVFSLVAAVFCPVNRVFECLMKFLNDNGF